MMHPANHLTVPLSKKEVFALITKAQEGDRRAKDKVILSYYRFVITCANKYFGRGVPLEDLISEGQIGLNRAVELFNVQRNITFASYAVWWIRSYVTSLVQEQGLSVRVPANFYYAGRGPNQSTKKYKSLTEKELEEKNAKRVERHRHVIEAIKASPRLQHENEFENSLVFDGASPDDLVAETLNKKRVKQILSELPARDAEVLRRRFGLNTGEVESLDEVGKSMGVSRERVRQIEAIAKRELKKKYRMEDP